MAASTEKGDTDMPSAAVVTTSGLLTAVLRCSPRSPRLAVELACRVTMQPSMRRDHVGLPAHELAPVQVGVGGPGDLDNLALLLEGGDARCGIVSFLVWRRSLMPI
jgi:hypothetical protein